MMECTLTFSFVPLSLKIHLDVEGGNGSWTDWEDSCSSPCGPGNLGRVENIISISIIKSTAKIPNSGKIMSTRSCAPEGSCMGDFQRMTRTCQEHPSPEGGTTLTKDHPAKLRIYNVVT